MQTNTDCVIREKEGHSAFARISLVIVQGNFSSNVSKNGVLPLRESGSNTRRS